MGYSHAKDPASVFHGEAQTLKRVNMWKLIFIFFLLSLVFGIIFEYITMTLFAAWYAHNCGWSGRSFSMFVLYMM